MEKIACGVIGATGMVGQNYIRLLEGHPWFDVCYVAASPSSAISPFRPGRFALSPESRCVVTRFSFWDNTL